MSTEGLTLNTPAFDAAIVRLAMTSKKAAVDVMKQQAKLLFVEVAKITPPSHAGVTGKTAEKHAKAKIAAEIYSLYGTASDAYDAIAAKAPAKASAFWFLEQKGETADANAILREATGSILYPFDGGVHHRRNFRKGSNRKRGFTFYVSNPQSLASYVQQQQSHVWWLASGWDDALSALGAKSPYGTDKHSASPGRLRVEVTADRIAITMENNVTYGREVKDIERRINWALNKRTDTLDRAWEHYLKRAAKDSGFPVK